MNQMTLMDKDCSMKIFMRFIFLFSLINSYLFYPHKTLACNTEMVGRFPGSPILSPNPKIGLISQPLSCVRDLFGMNDNPGMNTLSLQDLPTELKLMVVKSVARAGDLKSFNAFACSCKEFNGYTKDKTLGSLPLIKLFDSKNIFQAAQGIKDGNLLINKTLTKYMSKKFGYSTWLLEYMLQYEPTREDIQKFRDQNEALKDFAATMRSYYYQDFHEFEIMGKFFWHIQHSPGIRLKLDDFNNVLRSKRAVNEHRSLSIDAPKRSSWPARLFSVFKKSMDFYLIGRSHY